MFIINGQIWRVVIVSPNHPELIQPNGRPAIGCCNSLTKTIYISAEIVHTPLFKQVLSHEVAHAAVTSYGISLPLAQEEFLATFISLYGEEIVDIVDGLIEQALIV